MEKRRNNLFISIVLTGTLILSGLVVYSSLSFQNIENSSLNPIPIHAEEATEEITEESFEISAPNEKATLFVENIKLPHGNTEQTFRIKTDSAAASVEIYSLESDDKNFINVPLNTFSPDNRFIYLIEEGENHREFLLFRTDGKNIKGDQKFIEVINYFNYKNPDYVVTDVTGWGSYTQLVINTDNSDGKRGPSWWLDAGMLTFYKLTTRFN